ncbi:MAG: thioredoxin family protein [Desulfosarcina sp.]|nr:thioredoxin family protein [Desulfosarcina sp.]MBC2744107.1 thioredoxin family protein [Desulfosarcina sp.]MBC2767016.1 thioredoxin family protein [Desulfosarcina sp.]
MKIRWPLTAMALMLTLLATVLTPVPTLANDGGIQWFSYAEGTERSEAENKKVFMVFNADWCRYCHQMEKETFNNPTVITYVNRNFVPISVNSDKEQDIAAKYNVSGLPSSWFISETGERIGNRPGYISADEMLKILKYIGTDSYLTMSFKAFMEKEK